MNKPYGDGETFDYGGSMFRAAMKMCDDCDANDRPLAWFGHHIRICEACANKRRALLDEKP
jgi:hypothetical protein